MMEVINGVLYRVDEFLFESSEISDLIFPSVSPV